MVRYIIFIFIASLAFPLNSIEQELEPKGGFLKDSVKIGEKIGYYLSFKYPREELVLFPGASGNFAPFEYQEKEIFSTQTDSVYNYDSVVYYLSTFSITKQQELALPVFLVKDGDSTVFFTQPDTVVLNEVVQVAADTVALKENIGFHEIKRGLNYPYWITGGVVIVVIFLLVYFFLGKYIRKKWQIYQLHRQKKRFVKDFENDLAKLKSYPGVKESEKVLYRWKSYMENLEKEPYTKLTTREISNLTNSDKINRDLRLIDRGIYGKEDPRNLINYFLDLQKVSLARYQQKVEEIKHA